MDGDRPGKSPKPPLKAPKVDKQLGRLALYWGGRTKRRAPSFPSHVHARTRTRMHTHIHTHTYVHAHTYAHAHMYAHTHIKVNNACTHVSTQPYTHARTYTTHAHTHTYVHAPKQTCT